MDLELLDKYKERFNDSFPSMCFRCASDEELNAKIQECLNKNKNAEELYNLDYSDGIY